jgi:hypothetical protein
MLVDALLNVDCHRLQIDLWKATVQPVQALPEGRKVRGGMHVSLGEQE